MGCFVLLLVLLSDAYQRVTKSAIFKTFTGQTDLVAY